MNNLPENPDQTPEKKTANREPAKYPTRIEMSTTIIVTVTADPAPTKVLKS